jgi:antibiotic biosynthesis monooxygenase (ABM) superfamily enzyme
MSGVQLRRYRLQPGSTDDFLGAWRATCEVRAQYGFTVAAAVVDRENDGFVWIVTHDGDFEAADRAYYDSPERAALAVDPASFVAEKWLAMVDAEVLPGA